MFRFALTLRIFCLTIRVDSFARTTHPSVAATAPTIASITVFELNLIWINERTDQVGGAKTGITFKTKTTTKMITKTISVCRISDTAFSPHSKPLEDQGMI